MSSFPQLCVSCVTTPASNEQSLRDTTQTKSITYRKIQSEIVHVGQKDNWDCGLACSMMILQAANVTTPRNRLIQSIGRSIWTVDILNLLLKNDVQAHMYTITKGVDVNLQEQVCELIS